MHPACLPELLLEPLLPVDEPATLECLVDEVDDLLGREWLGQVVVGPALDGVDGGGDRALAGDDDHLGHRPAPLDPVEELEATHARQREVGEDDVPFLLLQLGHRLRRVLHRLHLVTLGAQGVAQSLTHQEIVVDAKDAGLPVRHGILPRNTGMMSGYPTTRAEAIGELHAKERNMRDTTRTPTVVGQPPC